MAEPPPPRTAPTADPAPAQVAAWIESLVALGRLADVPRSGWLLAGLGRAESVAAHSHAAQFVALALAPRLEPPVDLGRVLALLAVHDAAEALLTDLPRAAAELLPPGAKALAEERAAGILLGPLGGEAEALAAEYRTGAGREARFARACDRLEMGVRLVSYLGAGARGLGDFCDSLRALDLGEFPPAAALRDALVARADALDSGRRDPCDASGAS